MKRLVLLLALAVPAHAATWFATSSSVSINAANLWVPTSTGSCTGSGTALSFGAQADGDVFDANGCTALAVNMDPGAATGAGAGVCGTVTKTITLQTNATNGGGFTYATSLNIVIHANVTSTKTTGLTISGSTGGGTICGNVLGGATGIGVSDGHASVTVFLVGNSTGGAANTDYGWDITSSGPVTMVGNATGGTNTNTFGLFAASSGNASITGSCIGSNTAFTASGCNASSTGAITVTGNIINGLTSQGATGRILYTLGSTNYVLGPKDASYTLGVINSHSIKLTLGSAGQGYAQ